jgi:hypothetical protein
MYSRFVDVTLKGLTRQSGGVIRSVRRETDTGVNMRSPPLVLLIHDDNLRSIILQQLERRAKAKETLSSCVPSKHVADSEHILRNGVLWSRTKSSYCCPSFEEERCRVFPWHRATSNCSNVTMSQISGSLSYRSCILTKRGLTGEELNVNPPQAILEPLASFRHLIGQKHKGQPPNEPYITPYFSGLHYSFNAAK